MTRAGSQGPPTVPAASRWRGRRLLRPATLAVVVAMALLGGTTARWLSADEFSGGSVTAGDLALEVGTATWHQVTPHVTEPQSGEFGGTAPEGFVTMPGDVIEVRQPVTAQLCGDNLTGGIQVRLAHPDALDSDVATGRIAVGFAVLDADGRQVAPATDAETGTDVATLGDTVAVPGLTGTDCEVATAWTVVIRVHVLGDHVWTADAPTATGLWATGDLVVDLRQVRGDEDDGGAA